ncbi:MAG: hypothetical protein JNK82_41320 [Myxococcaceae bacterium]|nr:hypothetical protein [Myxococcaceae bacterium]
MGKPKSLKDKLWGAAVLKMSFRLKDSEDSPAYRAIYPGVLRDLGVDDAEVEKYIAENREAVEKAARGSSGGEPSAE